MRKNLTVYSNKIKVFLLVIIFIFLSACTEEFYKSTGPPLKASLDFAKLHEQGPSSIVYSPRLGINFVTYSPIFVPIFPLKDDVDNLRNNFHEKSGKTYAFGPSNLSAENTYKQENEPGLSYNESVYDQNSKAENHSKGKFGIEAGLEYIQKGGNFQAGGGKIKLNYLEIPIHILYMHSAGPGDMYAGLGPYFAYGVGGGYFGEEGGFKNFDAGLSAKVGYELKMGISLDVIYEPGLDNIEYPSQDVKGYNRVFSIEAGYDLGRLFTKK